MAKVPLGVDAFERSFGNAPRVRLINRFLEENPANIEAGVALLSRPGTTVFGGAGQGPNRGNHTLRGAFDNDLFVISGNNLYRVASDATVTPISGTISGTGTPEVCFVTGFDYERMFIADGATLQFYDGPTFATGTLTLTPNSPPDIATQVIRVGGVYYQWAADPTVGTPDGSMGDPFLVDVGVDDQASLANMAAAINASGTPGTTYSAELTLENEDVEATASDATTISLQARVRGSDGNSLATTVESGSDIAFGAATLTGGGTHALSGVVTPDDVGIVSVATINSYVICVASLSRRFYYITPGAITINALNFYEAESSPDEIVNVRVAGDTLWFLKERFSETWYATGDSEDPFRRQQGRAFSRGVVPGTALVIDDNLIFVDHTGRVRSGDGLQRLSNHGIEEVIRLALKAERESS